jgi:hypothetical protein
VGVGVGVFENQIEYNRLTSRQHLNITDLQKNIELPRLSSRGIDGFYRC